MKIITTKFKVIIIFSRHKDFFLFFNNLYKHDINSFLQWQLPFSWQLTFYLLDENDNALTCGCSLAVGLVPATAGTRVRIPAAAFIRMC